MQKLLAVLLLVALEAWSSGEKQKHIFFLEKKKTQQKTQKQNKQTTKKNKKNTQKTKLRLTEGWMFVKTVTTSNVGVNLTQKSLLFVHKN